MSYALPSSGSQDEESPLRLNVLVADDDEINRRVFSHILFGLNHEVKGVSTGLQAIKELTEGFYDVLFLDLHMPEMGGLEATRFILSMWGPEERPMIVALTADVTPGGIEKCIAAGMDGFLSKPVGIGSVSGMLAKVTRPQRRPQAT